MAAPINFESTWKKKEHRKQRAEFREQYIDTLKVKHEKEQRREEQRKLRGEDTWMLPSVSDRVESAEQEISRAVTKKEKKQKIDKKHKKEKKKKRGQKDSESETEWREVGSDQTSAKALQGPQLQRDSWMLDPTSDFGTLPSITKSDFNLQRNKDKQKVTEEDEKAKLMLEQPGQHDRELNPYWKDGGTGLPETEPSKSGTRQTRVAGDGGASWWRKAYQRCVQEAEDTGVSLEEIAANRYGSLKKLKEMMDPNKKDHHRDTKYEKPSSRHDDRNKDHYRDRGTEHRRDKYSSDSKSKGRSMFIKPGSDDEQTHDRSSSRSKFSGFMKPRDDDDGPYTSSSRSHSGRQAVPRWKKPGYSTDSRHGRSRSRSRSRERDRRTRRSRSRSPDRRQRSRSGSRGRRSRSRSRERRRKASRSPSLSYSSKRERRTNSPSTASSKSHRDLPRRLSSSESDTGTSDSSPSSSDSEPEPTEPARAPPEPVQVLTEQQLNELGAKIVKAEIMGDEELAASLKQKIEAARRLKASQPKLTPKQEPKKPGSTENEEVVLTRTDRSGMVRPLPASEHQDSGGRKRKQQKVKTHSEGGSRERYFPDDDKKDLKSLVEQERLGTAEDSNYEFLKLAGRAFKGKDLEDMDETFMEGATKETHQATIDLKDRARAIAEHRKTTAAMDKCQFCFDKVPKHLIVAIGLKVYLCLPNHRSMTEGHCLIVPMQHTTQSTVLDEDVFEEIQVFRRALTKMYQLQDLDCVLMETCMQLHKQRHMVIECVPLPPELGDMSPIYFKKAIQESESEWAQNKKVVDLSKKNIRNAVPKGFPYFAVNFGLQDGFAHVIEDEKTFPFYFGREIVGGMMDLDPTYWRKPHKESFEDQRKKVLAFAEWWKPVDWTKKLKE